MEMKTPKGTKDYLPEEMKKRKIVMKRFEEVFNKYGYKEIWTPAFEYLEVLEKKGGLGEESVKDIYKFQDKGGRWLGLRFDMTTPIARVIANNPNLLKPIKWYYISNMWRYENPQRGRLREFWQAGVENIGIKDELIDAEILALTYDALKKGGVKEFIFKINSRELIDKISKYYKIKNYPEFCKLLDKKDKLTKIEWKKNLKKFFIDKNLYVGFLRLIESQWDEITESIYSFAKKEIEYLEKVVDYSKDFGVKKKYLVEDISIVRGLEYYTGFIFETFKKGEEHLGSLASGGRYDNLIGLYSGTKIPATGMAIGIDRIMEIVSKSISSKPYVDILILPLKDSFKKSAVRLSSILREEGIPCDIEIGRKSIKKKLSYANSLGIKYCIILGEDEIKNKTYSLKNMEENKQYPFSLDDLINYIKKNERYVWSRIGQKFI